MIVIPDLFGAWQKGREEAIKANWQDLANYEKIENARTANDRANLALLGEMADYNIARSVAQDVGLQSRLAANLLSEQYKADMMTAINNAIVAGSRNAVLQGASNSGQLNQHQANLIGTSFNQGTRDYNNSAVGALRAITDHNIFTDPNNYAGYKTARTDVFNAGNKVNSYNAGNALANAQTAQTLYENGSNLESANIMYSTGVVQGKMAATDGGYNVGKTQGENLLLGGEVTQTNYQATLDSFRALPDKEKQAVIDNIRSRITALTQQLAGTTDTTARAAIQQQIEELNKQLGSLGAVMFNTPQTTTTAPVATVQHTLNGQPFTMNGHAGQQGPVVPIANPATPASTTPRITTRPTSLVPPARGGDYSQILFVPDDVNAQLLY